MNYQQFESQVLSTQASIMFSKAQTDMDQRKDEWRQLQRLYALKPPVTKYVQGLFFELESHIAQIQSFEKRRNQQRNQQRSQNYNTVYQFALEERNLSSKIENLEKQRDELKKINSSLYNQLKQNKKALKISEEYRVRAKQKQQKLTLELQKLNKKLEEWINKSNSFEKDFKSMERRYNFEKKERQELDEKYKNLNEDQKKYKSLNEKSQEKYRQYERLLQKKTQQKSRFARELRNCIQQREHYIGQIKKLQEQRKARKGSLEENLQRTSWSLHQCHKGTLKLEWMTQKNEF